MATHGATCVFEWLVKRVRKEDKMKEHTKRMTKENFDRYNS